jgi:hypothetical protein
MKFGFENPLLIAVGTEPLGGVFAIERGANPVTLHALRANLRLVARARAHRRQDLDVVVLAGLRLDRGEELGIQTRGTCGPVAIARPAHFDAWIVDHRSDLIEELRLILIRVQTHIERRLRL